MKLILRFLGYVYIIATLALVPISKILSTIILMKSSNADAVFADLWILDALCGIILSIPFLSADIYITRWLSESQAEAVKQLLSLTLLVTLASLLIIAIIYVAMSSLDSKYVSILGAKISNGHLMAGLLFSLSTNLYRIFFCYLRRAEKRNLLFIFNATIAILSLLALYSLLRSLIDPVASYYLAYSISGLLSLLSVVFIIVFRPELKPSIREIALVRSRASKNMACEPISISSNFLESLILFSFSSADTLSVLSISMRLVQPLNMLSSLVKYVSIKHFVNLVSSARPNPNFAVIRSLLLFSALPINFLYPIFIMALLSLLQPSLLGQYSISGLLVPASIILASNYIPYYTTRFFVSGSFLSVALIDIVAIGLTYICVCLFSRHSFSYADICIFVIFKTLVSLGLKFIVLRKYLSFSLRPLWTLAMILSSLITPLAVYLNGSYLGLLQRI